MAKELIHTFAIKSASNKIHKESKSFTNVGKKCTAIVVKDGNDLKARVTSSPVEDNLNEIQILSFTPNSFILKGKTHIFLKKKDNLGNRVCIIRDIVKATIDPGIPEQYDTLSTGLVVTGHVQINNGKKYFNYEEIVSLNEKSYINNIN